MLVMVTSFREIPPRVAWLRAILLGAMVFALLASFPLWMSARDYPLLPVAPWMPAIPGRYDQTVFAFVLACLAVACWFYRAGVSMFLAGSLLLVLADQNRAQPWFYVFWVLLFLSLATAPANLAACRFAVSAVYLWSGVQKLNPAFFKQVVPWFAEPASAWLPSDGLQMLRWLIALIPFVEIFIGLALWLRFTRMMAVIAAVALHLVCLAFLGPLRHDSSLVIWPWSLGMAALVITLFPRARIARTADLEGYFPLTVVVASFWLLPILSFFGKWPSYLSFAAYSGNLATGDMFITDSFRQRLPDSLRTFVQPTQPPFNPQIQGPYVFDHQRWAMKELHAPPFPEPEAFLAATRYLMDKYSAKPSEIRVVVVPRYGPSILCQGDQSWLIVPSM